MPDDDGNGSTLAVAPPRSPHPDPHDFAGLYIRHRASFTAHARRHLRDHRDADDVVQEAFLRLFLALPELETELQALAYGRRTITNLCIDRYRAQARRPYLVDLDTAHAEDLADDDPGDPVVRAEDAALVRSALSLLSPLQRAALVKREIEDKSLPVIAGELEIPEGSVKHLLFRSRRALRRLLASSSLAPGGDVDTRGLGLSAKAGSRGLAALLVLLVLGLGSGPDLEAIPVVGRDLPDVIGVTEMAETLRGVATEVGQRIAPSDGTAGTSPVGAGRLDSAWRVLSSALPGGTAEAAAAEADPRSGAPGRPVAGLLGLSAVGVAPASGSVPSQSGRGQVQAGVPLPAFLTPGSSSPSSTTALDRAVPPTSGGSDVPTAGTRPLQADGGSTPRPDGAMPAGKSPAARPVPVAAAPLPPVAAPRSPVAAPPSTVATPRSPAAAPQPPAAGNGPGRAAVPPRPEVATKVDKAASKADKAAAKAAVKAERDAAKAAVKAAARAKVVPSPAQQVVAAPAPAPSPAPATAAPSVLEAAGPPPAPSGESLPPAP